MSRLCTRTVSSHSSHSINKEFQIFSLQNRSTSPPTHNADHCLYPRQQRQLWLLGPEHLQLRQGLHLRQLRRKSL